MYVSYTTPLTLTAAEKRDRARRIKALEAALELGYRGMPRRITLKNFLKKVHNQRSSAAR